MKETTVPPKVLLAASLAVAVAVLIAAFGLVPGTVARTMNGRAGTALPAPSAEAVALHASLDVVDLHGDALLWNRPLHRRARWGHVDVPRLVEGRVALQGFTTVTKTPRGQNIEANDGDTDNITLLAILQRWPPRTWRSLTERALFQADKLRNAAERSGGRLRVVTSPDELDDLLAARRSDPALVGGFLGIEGAHALDGSLENLDRLHAAGFRMVGLTHFFDNRLGGSAHGRERGGLTAFGARVLARMEALGMFADVAHASALLVDDVLARARRPVVVSHGGVRGTCDNQRNLTDDQLRGLAATGGVVGIGLWETAVCGTTPEAWARAVRHAADVVGVEHVALGSDWDGAVAAIVDASETVHLVQALLDAGFDPDEVRRIMGANALRVLRAGMAPGSAG